MRSDNRDRDGLITIRADGAPYVRCDEEFALGIDPKSLHATVLMQTVYNAVVQHSGGFLKHMAISVTEKGKIMVA